MLVSVDVVNNLATQERPPDGFFGHLAVLVPSHMFAIRRRLYRINVGELSIARPSSPDILWREVIGIAVSANTRGVLAAHAR